MIDYIPDLDEAMQVVVDMLDKPRINLLNTPYLEDYRQICDTITYCQSVLYMHEQQNEETEPIETEMCDLCHDTGQIGKEEFYQGRSVGWRACPKCDPPGLIEIGYDETSKRAFEITKNITKSNAQTIQEVRSGEPIEVEE